MEDLNKFLEISNSKVDIILNDLLIKPTIPIENKIDVTDNVYSDTKIDDWAAKLPALKGGSILMKTLMKSPINNKEKLLERQAIDTNISDESLEILKKYEDDVLWIYTLKDEIDQDLSINLLFLSHYFVNNLNYWRPFVEVFHFYKIFVLPSMSLFYPISIFYTPYYYLNKFLKLNMTIKEYVKMLYNVIKLFFKRSSNIKNDIIKVITIFVYIFIYLYAIYQTFQLSNLIYKTRKRLLDKIAGLSSFINEAISIINNNIETKWKSFMFYENIQFLELDTAISNLSNFKPTINNVYKLWKSSTIRHDISIILNAIYTIDVANSVVNLKRTNNWCLANYTDETKIWGIKNPLLTNQITNPVDLSKNFIITGPNAAGKTTYVKSITANIILAQTMGIVFATKANVILYDTINTFMRITDVLGSKSYFEAETEYCSDMIKKAEGLSANGQKGLFIMDEPLHSTPPLEGMSTAFAVAEYIGKLEGIKIIITTHFHKLVELENKCPDKFVNLCVNAYFDERTNNYNFTYKIASGFSKQCIAIELLERQKFPFSVINSAIEMKEKICDQIYK